MMLPLKTPLVISQVLFILHLKNIHTDFFTLNVTEYNHAHYILSKDTAPKSTTTMLGNNLRGVWDEMGGADKSEGGRLQY